MVRELPVLDLPPVEPCCAPLQGAPFDGLLGGPFFRQYRVLFDLAARRLLISPYESTAQMPSGGVVRQ